MADIVVFGIPNHFGGQDDHPDPDFRHLEQELISAVILGLEIPPVDKGIFSVFLVKGLLSYSHGDPKYPFSVRVEVKGVLHASCGLAFANRVAIEVGRAIHLYFPGAVVTTILEPVNSDCPPVVVRPPSLVSREGAPA